jgi:hypothetical protein
MTTPTTIMLLPSNDGLLDDLIPDFILLLEEQLKHSGRLGSRHSENAYRDDIRRFNEWRAMRPITKSLVYCTYP